MKYLILLCFFSRALVAAEILLKNIHLIDPAAETISDGNLLLVNGRIKKLLPNVPKGFKGEVRELNGGWIIPGLTDMHAHTSRGNFGIGAMQTMTVEESTREALYAGVTSELDLFADENTIFRARDASRRKDWKGATLYAAGPMLTASHGHGSNFEFPARTMDNPQQAKSVVRSVAKHKPDVIKIAFTHNNEGVPLTDATMQAAIKEAKRLGIRTVIHIGTWEDAEKAVRAGATIITHFYDTEIPDSLVALMKARGVFEVPTMTYQTELVHAIENPAWLDSPLLVALAKADFLAPFHHLNPTIPYLQNRLADQRRGLQTYAKSLMKLQKAGIRIMAGTDAGGDLAIFQGFSVHREIQIYVEMGMTTWQALRSATSESKKFLGQKSGIHPGDLADFVVLESSPVSDITNTQKIVLIFHDGKPVDRASLIGGT